VVIHSTRNTKDLIRTSLITSGLEFLCCLIISGDQYYVQESE